jgi:predicted kinase
VIIFQGATAPAGYPDRTPTVRIPVALPAAGKSTLLRAWQAEDPDHRMVLGRDDWRSILGCLPVGTPAQEAAITIMMTAAAEALLVHGWDVGVDSTHIQPGTVAVWVELAQGVGARVEILDLTHITAETCIQRDLARRDAGGRYVGKAVIREMERLYLKGPREVVAQLR